jgi:uncharacterized membrane protein YhaH (DUF805 family)
METFFPETLNRLQYLVRLLIFVAIFFVVGVLLISIPRALGLDLPHWLPAIVMIPLLLMRIPCLDIPRLRSIGWSPWLVLLVLIPFVNLIFQLALFTMPSEEDAA